MCDNPNNQPLFATVLAIATILNEQCETKQEAIACLEKTKELLQLGFDAINRGNVRY